MKPGSRVRHRVFGGITGVVKASNGTTAFVLWRNGVGMECALNSLEAL